MNMLKLLFLLGVVVIIGACKDDGRDDTVLNMSDITGKLWYNNRWVGDKYSTAKEDILQVLKFEKNGKLISMDYSGRVESNVGEWTNKGNEITLTCNDGTGEIWDVMHSGGDYITVVVNEGERHYGLEPGYLQNLTADAFLVNEYAVGNSYRTYWGANVKGNNNIREAALILSSDAVVTLENHGYYWTESASEYIDFNGQPCDVRFYVKLGKDDHVKLSDHIYGQNIPYRNVTEFGLNASNKMGETVLTVSWNPFTDPSVYYRIEVYSGNMDLMNPYFISLPQSSRSELKVSPNTKGEVNRMKDLKSGDKYIIRLVSILYEPGTDVLNDEYGYANIQAVTYVTKARVWE